MNLSLRNSGWWWCPWRAVMWCSNRLKMVRLNLTPPVNGGKVTLGEWWHVPFVVRLCILSLGVFWVDKHRVSSEISWIYFMVCHKTISSLLFRYTQHRVRLTQGEGSPPLTASEIITEVLWKHLWVLQCAATNRHSHRLGRLRERTPPHRCVCVHWDRLTCQHESNHRRHPWSWPSGDARVTDFRVTLVNTGAARAPRSAHTHAHIHKGRPLWLTSTPRFEAMVSLLAAVLTR